MKVFLSCTKTGLYIIRRLLFLNGAAMLTPFLNFYRRNLWRFV